MSPRDIQRLLKASGYYNGGIDGDFGPKSREAVYKILERNKPSALKWSEARQRVAVAQIILSAAGYEPGNVDGWLGHNTQEAFNDWDHFVTTGKKEIIPARDIAPAPSPSPSPPPPGQWPQQKDMESFYGKAGGPACTAGVVQLPFAFRIAWNKSQRVTTFRCHTKVAGSFTSIYREAAKHYGETDFRKLGLDLFGGCFNFRKMRGGTSLSTHAYGIAVDHDPQRNQLRWGKDRAEFAKPVYNAFWTIVEAHGAVSLGRLRDFDWMHFQFARL